MTLRTSLYSPPTADPISLTEAKVHLQLVADATEAASYTVEDERILSHIMEAVDAAESETWQSIMYRGVDLFLDSWPVLDELELPLAPLRSIEFVRYTDVDGEVREFDAYSTDPVSCRGRMVLDYGESWPSEQLRPNNPIHVRFWAGILIPFTVDTDTNTILAPNHPFTDGELIRFSVSGGALPGGLATRTDYLVTNSTNGTLQVTGATGGEVVSLSGIGSGNLFIGERPMGIITGIKLLLLGLRYGDTDMKISQAASHWFSSSSIKRL